MNEDEKRACGLFVELLHREYSELGEKFTKVFFFFNISAWGVLGLLSVNKNWGIHTISLSLLLNPLCKLSVFSTGCFIVRAYYIDCQGPLDTQRHD